MMGAGPNFLHKCLLWASWITYWFRYALRALLCQTQGKPLLTNSFPHLTHPISSFSTAFGLFGWGKKSNAGVHLGTQSVMDLIMPPLPFCSLGLYWWFHQHRCFKCICASCSLPYALVKWEVHMPGCSLNGLAGHDLLNVIYKTHGRDCIMDNSLRHCGCILKTGDGRKNSTVRKIQSGWITQGGSKLCFFIHKILTSQLNEGIMKPQLTPTSKMQLLPKNGN